LITECSKNLAGQPGTRSLRILALEPYYGGSHRAFLTGWSERSRHSWTVLSLPARKWKWRMRHAAVTLAEEVRQRALEGAQWDLILCSDMLNLAEFRGLSSRGIQDLPCVAYFHENQITYPVRHEDERDFHYGLINMTTALAANAVWFNSEFHRGEFLDGLDKILRRMPDHRLPGVVDQIRQRSSVQPQGITSQPSRPARSPGPLRILWAARWEHDKDPDTFFRAIEMLAERKVPFRLSVLGQSFREIPEAFERARVDFQDHLEFFGYQESRAAYEDILGTVDVIVSTALHEFFGISVAEAVAAGAWPLVPQRLAYPELLQDDGQAADSGFFHGGTAESVAEMLEALAEKVQDGGLWEGDPERGRRLVARYTWDVLAPHLDDGLEGASRCP